MISKKMNPLVQNNSVIRVMFEEGKRLAAIYGAENVYDFSLGNPNVPAPQEVEDSILETLKEEESTFIHGYMSNSGYELVVAIANGGYSDMVMEAASAAGAQGGTVLHTRAADAANGNKFFGMAITEEREMILLVTPAEKRAAIMQAIMEKAGAQSEAQSVVFSVALDEVAGLYSVES